MANGKKNNLLTVKQVSERLSISRQTLYNMRMDGKINYRIIGTGAIRFSEEDVATYLEESSQNIYANGK